MELETGQYYAFNVGKYSLLECFSNMKTFKDLFTQTHIEMMKMHNANGTGCKETHQLSNVHPTVQQDRQDQQKDEVALPAAGKVFSYERISYMSWHGYN